VRAGKDAKPVTDGVFPESKEFLATLVGDSSANGTALSTQSGNVGLAAKWKCRVLFDFRRVRGL
jgi:hypothetical protein